MLSYIPKTSSYHVVIDYKKNKIYMELMQRHQVCKKMQLFFLSQPQNLQFILFYFVFHHTLNLYTKKPVKYNAKPCGNTGNVYEACANDAKYGPLSTRGCVWKDQSLPHDCCTGCSCRQMLNTVHRRVNGLLAKKFVLEGIIKLFNCIYKVK